MLPPIGIFRLKVYLIADEVEGGILSEEIMWAKIKNRTDIALERGEKKSSSEHAIYAEKLKEMKFEK
jgi:hypothetical protein